MLARLNALKEITSNSDDIIKQMLIAAQRVYPLSNQVAQLNRLVSALFDEASQLFQIANQTESRDDHFQTLESYLLIEQFVESLKQHGYISTNYLLFFVRLNILICELSLNTTFYARATQSLNQIEDELKTASLNEAQRHLLNDLIREIKSAFLNNKRGAALTANYANQMMNIDFANASDPESLRTKPYLGIPDDLVEHARLLFSLAKDLKRARLIYSVDDPLSSQRLLSFIALFYARLADELFTITLRLTPKEIVLLTDLSYDFNLRALHYFDKANDTVPIGIHLTSLKLLVRLMQLNSASKEEYREKMKDYFRDTLTLSVIESYANAIEYLPQINAYCRAANLPSFQINYAKNEANITRFDKSPNRAPSPRLSGYNPELLRTKPIKSIPNAQLETKGKFSQYVFDNSSTDPATPRKTF